MTRWSRNSCLPKLCWKPEKKQGLTQQELARRTGIDQADISKIEHGKLSVSFKTMRKLANGMGKPLRIQLVDEI